MFFQNPVTIDKHLVPNNPPPFIVINIGNGIDSIKFVHLQNGAKKEDYGDLFIT